MSFRKIMFGLLTLWLALAGIVCGTLFLFCLSIYLLWYGLSASVIVFGGLCVTCVALTFMALRHATAKGKLKQSDSDLSLMSQGRSDFFPDSLSKQTEEEAYRHKML